MRVVKGFSRENYEKKKFNKASDEIRADFTKAEVAVECTDSVEVWVNGEKAGIILWAPNKVDVTNYLKKGENDIEIRVTSTLSNMLNIAIDTGIKAPVKINLYK